MNKSNYALISALYDTKDANLYNDIYFPIIKYGITNLYYTQKNIEKYYELSDLQNAISDSFGIKIPLQVLKQSVRVVGNGNNDVSISIFENGKRFKIKKAWDIALNVSIDNKSEEIETKFSTLELLFKRFLEAEQLSFEKPFLDFFSDNTEEIFNYVEENENNAIINEKYVNVTRFLTCLKNENIDLFNIANDIFWGAIIAGFLKRKTVEINIKPIEKVEYYLDTALVLAILDLDNQDNVSYGQELLEIIKSSGNIPKVHSLTIREISNILTSVEREQIPRPNSAIEEAYHRRDLTPSKILQIKNKLSQLIEEKGISIWSVSENELDTIEIEYKNKKSVKDLEKYRNPFFYNYTIRDIHDVYLRDFIKKKRGDKIAIEKINSYFVSLNTELISYFKQESTSKIKSEIIHPAKIITDLWIHNSQCTLLKENALTEVMSRCFALNNTDIRRKLRLVSKYYKETDTDYSEDTYRAIYSALINRSSQALKAVEEISITEQANPTNKEEINRNKVQALIKIAVDEETNKKQRLIALTKAKEQLEQDIKSKDDLLSVTDKSNSQDKEIIKQLKKKLEINEKINEISTDISELEKNKDQSISKVKYYIIIGLEIIFVLGFIVCLLFLILSYTKNNDIILKEWIKDNISLLVGGFISAIGFLCRVHNMYLLSPKIRYEDNTREQINYWISKNPKYNELKDQLSQLQNERKGLNNAT
jgi:hypothetical protein